MSTVIIQKRKRIKGTVYPVYYKDPLTGKKKYHKTFSRMKDAQQTANDLRRVLEGGRLPEQKIKIKLKAFEEVGKLLIDKWNQKRDRQALSEKTYSDYCYWLNRLNQVFGKKLLCEISKSEVESHINSLAAAQSNITANKYLSIIKKVFCHGMAIHAVINNPVADIRPFSEKDHERNKFLLPYQLDRLIKAAEKGRAKYYLPAIIFLGAEHGAATQEILSLKWSDIDFEYSEQGLIRFFRTKNKQERIGFIMPRTRQALLSWRDHLKRKREKINIDDVKSDFVFTRLDGTPIKTFKKAWRVCLKNAGIDDFHFHDLRHTFCSNLILSGADLKDAKEMIGHKDISMTDRYSHLTAAHKLKRQEVLAAHYINGVKS